MSKPHEYQKPLGFNANGSVLAREIVKGDGTIRCEGRLMTPSARTQKTGKPPWDLCPQDSKYNIDGHFYCKKHAGMIALIALLEMQDGSG